MTMTWGFRQFAGCTSVLLFFVIWATLILLLIPLDWDVSNFANPDFMLNVGSGGAKHIGYGMVGDLFWYLLHIPLALYF